MFDFIRLYVTNMSECSIKAAVHLLLPNALNAMLQTLRLDYQYITVPHAIDISLM